MIDILLAAYNGQKYLAEQIDSILRQSYSDWTLFIQDDGSTDDTPAIARAYANRYTKKIIFIRQPSSGSAKNNFFNMLALSRSPYTMFCDQDDIWLDDKIKNTLLLMKEQESAHAGAPVLVHTDLAVADENKNIISPSFMRYQGLNPKYNQLGRLLVQNNVTGCTMMINRTLRERLNYNDTEKILMHDWWIALTAAAFGYICFCDAATILYRQHSQNQLGAVNPYDLRTILRALRVKAVKRSRLSVTYEQARYFYKIYEKDLDAESLTVLSRYLSVPRMNKFRRVYTLINFGYLKQNFITAVGQLLFC